jgi:hypothetical protein
VLPHELYQCVPVYDRPRTVEGPSQTHAANHGTPRNLPHFHQSRTPLVKA